MSRLFFDVDTQNDFINPDGALYIPGAEKLKANFKKLIEYARNNSIPIWGSIDAHLPDDPELLRNGGEFPDHCMLGTKGQEKIEETKPLNPKWVENRDYSEVEIEKLLKHRGEIYFQKQSFNVFDNPATGRCIKDFENIVVFGVATDYCVKSSVLGFLERGAKVFLVTDAVKSINFANGEKAIREMEKKGANFISSGEILAGKVISN